MSVHIGRNNIFLTNLCINVYSLSPIRKFRPTSSNRNLYYTVLLIKNAEK